MQNSHLKQEINMDDKRNNYSKRMKYDKDNKQEG